MRIYIESTSPSYGVSRSARDIPTAVRQQLTRDWWHSGGEEHELFASQVVLDEIAFSERAMADRSWPAGILSVGTAMKLGVEGSEV